MNNIEQFGLYTAEILDTLYRSFPIPIKLNRKDIILTINEFTQTEELKDLKSEQKKVNTTLNLSKDGTPFQKLSIAAGSTLPTEEEVEEARAKKPTLDTKIHNLNTELQDSISKQKNIYKGTFDFLISEGLIKEHFDSDDCFSLTNKSFSHLNKTFSGKQIEEKNKSDIRKMKGDLGNSLMSTSVSATVNKAIGFLLEAAAF